MSSFWWCLPVAICKSYPDLLLRQEDPVRAMCLLVRLFVHILLSAAPFWSFCRYDLTVCRLQTTVLVTPISWRRELDVDVFCVNGAEHTPPHSPNNTARSRKTAAAKTTTAIVTTAKTMKTTMTVSAPCWPMLLAMALLLAANTASGFVPLGATLFAQRTQRCGTDITELFQHDSRTKGKKTTASATNFLLRDFETFDGEVIDPYKILKVRRKASVAEIKRAYRNLSRRYHPDAARQRDILPGKW